MKKAIEAGVISTGRQWYISESRLKAEGLNKGQHLIVVLADDIYASDLTLAERVEIIGVAEGFASKQTGKYRIAYNGPELGTRLHFHIHIMFPEREDKLPPIVKR